MDIEERRDWLEDVLKGLKEKIESDSNYLQGRANRNQGVQRSTDVLMSRHLQVLRDIYNTLEAELDTYLVPPPLGQPHTGYTGLITPQYPTNPQPKP